jgi:hypothetical protein
VSGCDFLWAMCGVCGAVYRALCGVRAAVCGGVRAVMFVQSAVVAAMWDVVWVCGACVLFGACVSVRCAVRGLLVCAVLGDTRLDADVVFWWVGLVASCVCARACLCGVMVAGSAALSARSRWAFGYVKNRGCVIGAMCNARVGRALPALSRAQ